MKINEELARTAAASGVRRAVETGTYMGESTKKLAQIFDQVETIELSRYIALKCWVRLLPYRNIRLRLGDSSELLKSSWEPTLYWLDGHWSGGGTAGQDRQCPVLGEIRATSPGTYGDWYLIDDAHLFTGPLPDWLDAGQWPTFDQIRDAILQARPGYEVSVREDLDLIVARPPAQPA
jgi:hypothetical protein